MTPNSLPPYFIPPATRDGFKAVSLTTVLRLLHKMQYRSKPHTSTLLYMSHHERPDVVRDRKRYLTQLDLNKHRTVSIFTKDALAVLTNHLESAQWSAAEFAALGCSMNYASDTPILDITADEAATHANDSVRVKSWYRPGDVTVASGMKKKGRGVCIMLYGGVSGFGVEYGTAITVGSARGGYWTKARMEEYARIHMPALRKKYPGVLIRIHLDNSSNHLAMRLDALWAGKLNKGDGGTRKGEPIELKKTWKFVDANGRRRRAGGNTEIDLMQSDDEVCGLVTLVKKFCAIDKIVFPAGTLKVEKWSKAALAEYLTQLRPDFKYALTNIQEVASEFCSSQKTGGRIEIVYAPRFHCDLMAIERIWAFVKRAALRELPEIDAEILQLFI